MKQTIIIIFFIIGVIVSFIFGRCTHSAEIKKEVEYLPSDTITLTDTIFDKYENVVYEPIPDYIETIRYDTFFKDTILPIEHKIYNDTSVCASDTIINQISISGVKPSLDSVKVKFIKSNVIETKYVYLEKKKTWKDKIRLSPSIIGGYDFINQNFGIMVGFGLSIDI